MLMLGQGVVLAAAAGTFGAPPVSPKSGFGLTVGAWR